MIAAILIMICVVLFLICLIWVDDNPDEAADAGVHIDRWA